MRIKWLAHASFLISGDGLRIITDPYEPNDVINLPPITEPADIVIRSSSDDEAHCFVDTIPAGYELVTATEIVGVETIVKGVKIEAIWSQESLIHKDIPRDNAMYRFNVEGINITHMGDIGNPLSDAQIEAMAGTDVLLALTGGPPTIELLALHEVIARVGPRVVIPMHYQIPGPRFFMLPVTAFSDVYPADMVVHLSRSEVAFTRETLPDSTQIVILAPALFRNA